MSTIPLDSIIIGDRLREDLGDIDGLAQSISLKGLIHPLVLNLNDQGQHELIAGGRRITALKLLGVTELHHGITCDPSRHGFVYANELPEDIRREIELEENVARKEMTWQERIKSIAEIHQIKRRRAVLGGEQWGIEETGKEIGKSSASVSIALTLAKELRNVDSPVHKASNAREALTLLTARAEQDAKKLLLAKSPAVTVAPSIKPPTAEPDLPFESSSATEADSRAEVSIRLSDMLYHGDSMHLMYSFAQDQRQVDHIICDPPYGIDMDNLEQSGTGMDVSSVRDTHHVDANIQLMEDFIQRSWDCLKPGGFLSFWYDTDHHEKWLRAATKTGFKVQRWPFIWCKTTAMNQASGFNMTKATEVAMVCRKGNATLVNHQPRNWVHIDKTSEDKLLFDGHPFAKPIALWTHLFNAVCLKGQTVLDPFAGRGSSTIAAIRFGLHPIACELDDAHYPFLVENVRDAYTSMLPDVTINFT